MFSRLNKGGVFFLTLVGSYFRVMTCLVNDFWVLLLSGFPFGYFLPVPERDLNLS
jgi:hypothetical protein